MTVFQDHFRNVPTEEFLQPNPHTTMLLSPFGYTIVSRIYTPFTYKPPLHFQPKFLHRYFYLTYRHPNQWPFYQNNVPTPSSSRSLWQRKNEASIHRTAKEFAVHVRDSLVSRPLESGVNQQRQHIFRKDKPAECLENAAVYAVANLCQSILTIKFLGLGGRQN